MRNLLLASLVLVQVVAGCSYPLPRASGAYYGPPAPYRQPSAGLTGYAEGVVGETIHFNPCRGKPRNVRRSYGASASVSVDDYYGVEVDRDYYGRTSGECP